jgi:hypothetical protein
MSAMDLEPRQIALSLARARAVNGLVMLLLPGAMAKSVFGSNNAVVRALLRIVGIRDLVLGVGAITTLKEHTQDAEWVGMGAVADGVDAVVLLITPGLPKRGRLVSAMGASAAVAGLLSSRALADARKPAFSEVDA